MNALAKKNGAASAVEAVLMKGDLRQLSEEDRLAYYRQVCDSLGLNPLTQPFGYIEFQGKLRLYALRACTDQLRKLHGISVSSLRDEERDGVLTVTASVRSAEGRTDEDIGCVVVAGLKGEALANARMKTVTKAKRRATLSICGLGWLDESELDTLPEARPVQQPHPSHAEAKDRPAFWGGPNEDGGKPSPVEPLPQLADRNKLPPKGKGKADLSPGKLMTDALDRERELVGAGVIGPGELVAALKDYTDAEGFPGDYKRWDEGQVKDARKFLARWVAQREEDHAGAAAK